MKACFVVCLALVCGVLSFAQGPANAPAKAPTALEQTLMNAEKSFIDAAKKGDVAFFKRTLTDDFSFVAFDGQCTTARTCLTSFRTPAPTSSPMT